MNFNRTLAFLSDKKKANYLVLGLLAVFLLISALIYFLPLLNIDVEFTEEVQETQGSILNTIMKSISWFGNSWIAISLVAITALALYLIKNRKEALFVILTLSVTIINSLLKVLISRKRPTEDMVEIIVKAQHQSFPSGHVSFYVVFFGFVIFLLIKQQYLSRLWRFTLIGFSLFLIITIPLSRVYLGVHWFTDVTAGFVLGLIVLYTLIRTYLKKKAQ